ncbi:MAG: DJ-1/PfpI family protein [Bradymonadia bacterium]
MIEHIGIVLYPDFTQLDAMGPFEVFSHLPGVHVHLVAAEAGLVRSDTGGLQIMATTDFESCPPLDVICIPGGNGTIAGLTDAPLLSFIRAQAQNAQAITSVCTGALLLGAAGLLKGRKATTHWAFTDALAAFGAEHVAGRVVRDEHLFTGGGVTAGIDFALTLVAELISPEVAQGIQLGLEYAPAPPFDAGHPDSAPEHVKAMLMAIKGPHWREGVETARMVARGLT